MTVQDGASVAVGEGGHEQRGAGRQLLAAVRLDHDVAGAIELEHIFGLELLFFDAAGRHVDGVTVFELTHVELTSGCGLFGPVRLPIDHQRAHPANTLAAIVVECDGFFAVLNQALVDDIEHLQK